MPNISWAQCFSNKGASYNDMYEEVPPGRGSFFRPQVYERVGVSQFEEFERVA